jgi:ketosteroid isomerase-like protein
MSADDVEIVRRFLVSYESGDMVPRMREFVERVGPDFQPDAVLAEWAQDPVFQHIHPDIEWDARASGLSATARGQGELALWWVGVLEMWESYVVRVAEYRDLGDWVLVLADTQARGREGIVVERRLSQLHQAREGKVAVFRSFRTEQEALEAVGLA